MIEQDWKILTIFQKYILKQVLGKAKSSRKNLYHYLTCLAIGLMTLSILLIRKILSAAAELKMQQALNC